MSEARTVTVPTPDGPVVLPEPDWCTRHSEDRLDYRALAHQGDEFQIDVHTPAGPITLLTGHLQQHVWPSTTRAAGVVYVLALAHGDAVCSPEQLRAVYRSAVDQLRQLLDRADQLDVIRGGGQ